VRRELLVELRGEVQQPAARGDQVAVGHRRAEAHQGSVGAAGEEPARQPVERLVEAA
jgi:hypothetical protein